MNKLQNKYAQYWGFMSCMQDTGKCRMVPPSGKNVSFLRGNGLIYLRINEGICAGSTL